MTIAEFVNKVGFKVKDDDIDQVNGVINNIKNRANSILGAIGIGLSLVQLNQTVEEFGRINDQIKNSTSHLGDQKEIQDKIMKSAAATRTEYAQTARVISDLVHENAELFGDVDEAAKFNNAATMLFKAAGKTNEEVASLMEAINKSFAKGYIDSETLSQLLERSPEAIELINKKLGTTSDKLEEMASEGLFTVTQLKEAFTDNAEEIAAKFSGVKMRVSDALTVIRNKWGLWLTQTDDTLEMSSEIARTMVRGFDMILGVLNRVRNGVFWLADALGGPKNLLKMIAIIGGSIFGVIAFPKIIAGLKAIGAFLGAINLKTVAIIAVVAVLGLLVEDFIAFMKGEDSLIGEILEATGVDVDAARQMFQDFWTYMVEGFQIMWVQLKEICGTFMAVVFDLFKAFGSLLSGDWEQLWADLQQLLSDALTLIDQLFTLIFGDIWIAVKQYASDIAQSVIDGINEAVNFITSLPGQAVTWGKDIIQGLVDGITAGVTWLTDAVSGIAQEIKDYLGFSEPEKGPLSNFHTYMPDMFDLMSEGLEEGRKKIRPYVEQIASEIAILANTKTVSPSTAATAVTNSTSNRAVYQNVEINNKFEGDMAAQKNASTAMKKAGGDVTAQLARGLCCV